MAVTVRHRLHWYQYSLGSLFVLTLLAAICGSWFASKRLYVERQRAAVQAIEGMGGAVAYDHQIRYSPWNRFGEPPGPAWLRAWLGDDVFAHVVLVHLRGEQVADGGLEYLVHEHLEDLSQLHVFDIDNTKVTDAGLEHLCGMHQLETLRLNGTSLTDAALAHLKGLTRLTELRLVRTRVTDAGLEHLTGLSRLETLSLDSSQVTDAGLQHLTGLTQLREVHLRYTRVTSGGIMRLQQALPNCTIVR